MSHKDSYIDQEAIENQNRTLNNLNERNQINFAALNEGARLNEEKRAEEQRQIREQEIARQQVRDAKITDLLSKAGQSTADENKARADAAIAVEIAKAEAEIKAKQNKLHNVKEDSAQDRAWRDLVKELKE